MTETKTYFKRRLEKFDYIQVWIRKDLKRRMQEQRLKEERSVSKICVSAIEKYLEDYERSNRETAIT